MLLLRALVSPLMLIGTVVLSFGAALGISALIFQYVFGFDACRPGVPAVRVRVPRGPRHRLQHLPDDPGAGGDAASGGRGEGSLVALSATGGVITSAGLVLAATFVVLATMPLVFSLQLGTAVALGVMLDTMIVRSVLVTALNLDLGGKIWWPSRLDRHAPSGRARAGARQRLTGAGASVGVIPRTRSLPSLGDWPAWIRWGTSPVRPTRQQIRRALARAERGAALDADRGDGAAGRARGGARPALRRRGAGSATPAFAPPGAPGSSPTPPRCSSRSPGCAGTGATTARSSPRPASSRRAGEAPYLSPDEILDIARQGAELGCLEALFTLGDRPEDRWPEARAVAGRAGLRLDARLRPGDGDPGAGGDRAAAAPQPRRHVLGGDQPAQARRPVDGDDAGDHLAAALRGRGRGPLRVARQGPRGPAAGAGGRRAALGAVHDRAAGRHRRDPGGARRDDLRAAGDGAALRRGAGGDRPELPRQAGHRDAARRRPRPRRATAPRSRSPGSCSGRRCGVQAPPNLVDLRRSARAARRRRRRLGRGLAADPRPRQPRAALAVARAAARRSRRRRLRAAAAADRPPRVRRRRRAVARPAGLGPRRRAGGPTTGLARAGVRPVGPAVAGAGRRLRLRRPGPHRPARRHRHRRAAPTTAAATSTRSTATGTPCGSDGPRRSTVAPGPDRRPSVGGLSALRGGRAGPGGDHRRAGAGPDDGRRRAAGARCAGWPTTCAARRSATR